MSKKPGFQVKIGGETILYIVVFILIFGFMFFMPNIYKFISDLKTGNLFKKNETPVVENNNQNNEEDNNNNNNKEEIAAQAILVCTSTTSKPEGNFIETYTFYYNDDKLEKLKNEKNYDAITDEYLNYVYSQRAKFNNINNLYKVLPGFSYTSTLESRTLIATFIYDLTKLNPKSLSNEDEDLNIALNVTKNQSSEEVKTIYTGLGYNCR